MWEKNALKIINALTETAIYVIEQDTYRLLFYNRKVKEVSPHAEVGLTCYKIWDRNCTDCPLLAIGDKHSNHTIHYNDPFGDVVDITADRIMWDEQTPAFVITVTPHKLNYEEEQGLEKIEKMYKQSLVTVFDECIIANLTDNYFVNCQKDMMWTDIPEKGEFDRENQLYAKTVVHPEDLSEFNANFSRQAMLQLFSMGKKQISKRLRRKMPDGTYHMVQFTAVKIEQFDEDACWCVLVFRDINDDYLQEQRMNVDINQLATAAKIAYQMLIAVNLTQNSYYMIEYDNFQTKKAAVSGNFDELIETGVSTVAPEYKEEFFNKFSRKSLLNAFAKGEKQVTMEMRQMGDDGHYHWNSTQVVRVDNPYSDDVLEITMSKNIDSERKQQEENLKKERRAKQLLEEALQNAEAASSAKSHFLSRMSHDIRTPMNAIVGMTALAQLHIHDQERLMDFLKKIESSGTHLLGLINEVLDMSKIESGTMDLEEIEFDISILIQDVYAMMQPIVEKKQQDLQVHISDNMHPYVSGDQQRLRQVLVNVLENASKYTRKGGKIRLSAKELKGPETAIGTYQFIIEDNGIGMKKSYLEHIFEPFSRADDSRISKIAGTGLGMTIVQNIIKMMDGDIQVESQYGKGSRFTITLCLVQRKEDSAPLETSQMTPRCKFSDLRILLVEDNEINQEIASEMLKHLGPKVELAENGQKALELILEKPAHYYDLVFMDIQMPVMNGYEAVKKIRASGKEYIDELPIIAMTADAFSDDVKRAHLAGMNGHLAKPINIEQLREVLTQCVVNGNNC